MMTIPRVVAVTALSPSCSTVTDSSVTPSTASEAFPDPRCNGTLRKQHPHQQHQHQHQQQVSVRPGPAEDSSGQRYSADPTVLLGERAGRGETDEDGYMTATQDKNPTGIEIRPSQSSSGA